MVLAEPEQDAPDYLVWPLRTFLRGLFERVDLTAMSEYAVGNAEMLECDAGRRYWIRAISWENHVEGLIVEA